MDDIGLVIARLEGEVKRLTDAVDGKAMSRLWSVADIARYVGVSPPTARSYISHPTFPEPIILPSTKNSPRPKWNSVDVKTWVLGFQQNRRKKKLRDL